MELIVDKAQRFAKMRAHTATHLLHAQIAKIFPSTKQEGSQVDNDAVRFDFATDRLLTQEEIAMIEKRVNQIIYLACEVSIEEMSMDAATKLGAKAFFEDKYGDKVRVVQIPNVKLPPEMQQDDNVEYFGSFGDMLSIELCGGTHVANTKDIGCFAIVSQEAVASGVKRLTAVTGPAVYDRMHDVQSILDVSLAKLGIKTPTQLADKLDKILKEYDEMQTTLETLEGVVIKNILQGSDFSSGKDLDKVFKLPKDINFKNVGFHAKSILEGQNVLLFNEEGNFVLLTKKGDSAKTFAQKLGLKGGGTDSVVQGRDAAVLGLFT